MDLKLMMMMTLKSSEIANFSYYTIILPSSAMYRIHFFKFCFSGYPKSNLNIRYHLNKVNENFFELFQILILKLNIILSTYFFRKY